MEDFESTPEGTFGVHLSVEYSGSPEAAYLTWEAMVRTGFASGNAVEALNRRSINDAYIERLMLAPDLGAYTSEVSPQELLRRLKVVCLGIDQHPALADAPRGICLLIAGVWLRSHLLSVTLEDLILQCSEEAYRTRLSPEVTNMIIWWFDVNGSPGAPELTEENLTENLVTRFGLPLSGSEVFANLVMRTLEGLSPGLHSA